MKRLFLSHNLDLERKLFLLVLLITSLFLFYPPYLPMVDLPQHAAQVVMLDDLWKQQSAWSDLVVLNWDTPYLAGYSIWWLLYQFADIVTSSKILVTLILLINCWAIHLLRKTFQAPVILEWAALTSFFGFAFQWGFITFLIAIPIGMLFFITNKYYLETREHKYLIGILLLGCLTYFSHILIFSFFCFISYCYFLTIHFRHQNWMQRFQFTLVYLLFAAMLFRYVSKPDLLSFNDYSENYVFAPIWYKILTLVYMPWNMERTVWCSISWVALLILPRRMGYRPTQQYSRYIPLIAFLIIWFLLPHSLFQTAFIYERFAIFLMPFYYLIWDKNEQANTEKDQIQKIKLMHIIFILTISGLMFKVYYNNIRFAHDPTMQAYLKISNTILPKKRILMLFDSPSPSSGLLTSNTEYLHFGSWYQAQKHGWTDFNFAAYRPQIVRFKPDKLPPIPSRSGSATQQGITQLTNCADYDYLLMNTTETSENITQWLNDTSSCNQFYLIDRQQNWLLFKRI